MLRELISPRLTLMIGDSRLILSGLQHENATGEIPNFSRFQQALRGHFAISIYACIEYTLTECCSYYIRHVKDGEYLFHELRHNIKSILLDDKLTSVESVNGGRRCWDKRDALFDAHDSSVWSVNESITPLSGNVSISVMKEIWQRFCLSGDIVPNNYPKLYDEIKEARNSCAHGRELASEVWKNKSFEDLKERLEFTIAATEHMLQSFESAIENRAYLVT